MGALAHAGKECKHLILYHQRPDCLQRTFRLKAVVPNPQLDLTTVDAAEVIDVLEPDLCGASACREFRRWTRERLVTSQNHAPWLHSGFGPSGGRPSQQE